MINHNNTATRTSWRVRGQHNGGPGRDGSCTFDKIVEPAAVKPQPAEVPAAGPRTTTTRPTDPDVPRIFSARSMHFLGEYTISTLVDDVARMRRR